MPAGMAGARLRQDSFAGGLGRGTAGHVAG